MSIDSAIVGIVRRRMQRLQEDSETSNQLLGKLNVPPGPFIGTGGSTSGKGYCVW
jgi:hypothetical protein